MIRPWESLLRATRNRGLRPGCPHRPTPLRMINGRLEIPTAWRAVGRCRSRSGSGSGQRPAPAPPPHPVPQPTTSSRRAASVSDHRQQTKPDQAYAAAGSRSPAPQHTQSPTGKQRRARKRRCRIAQSRRRSKTHDLQPGETPRSSRCPAFRQSSVGMAWLDANVLSEHRASRGCARMSTGSSWKVE